MIQKENILQASYSEFDRETDFELEAIYNYSLQSLILEVTQKCNFRCKYCIYHSFNEYYKLWLTGYELGNSKKSNRLCK